MVSLIQGWKLKINDFWGLLDVTPNAIRLKPSPQIKITKADRLIFDEQKMRAWLEYNKKLMIKINLLSNLKLNVSPEHLYG